MLYYSHLRISNTSKCVVDISSRQMIVLWQTYRVIVVHSFGFIFYKLFLINNINVILLYELLFSVLHSAFNQHMSILAVWISKHFTENDTMQFCVARSLSIRNLAVSLDVDLNLESHIPNFLAHEKHIKSYKIHITSRLWNWFMNSLWTDCCNAHCVGFNRIQLPEFLPVQENMISLLQYVNQLIGFPFP